jgi:putative DNA-invertase from lambdoid prophage Rac
MKIDDILLYIDVKIDISVFSQFAEAVMARVMGYIRVSTTKQDADNQRREILEYTNQNNLHVDAFIEIGVSPRRDKKQRRIEELLSKLQPGDTLVVSELSRLGHSTSEVIDIVNELIAKEIKFVAIKQGLDISGQHGDMQTRVVIAMFSLFGDLERDIITERTKAALAARKASGKRLGKPKGTLQESKLDPHRQQIMEFLEHGVAKSAIARMLGTSRTNLINYIKTRGLESPKEG